MFEDRRSRKIILLAHCLLNQNAISDGTADFPGQFREVVELIMKNQVGIVQLPCPELLCLGLARGDENGRFRELLQENSRIRDLMGNGENIAKMREQAGLIVGQLQDYKNQGFDIIGLVGINRSPSCGLETTSIRNTEAPGRGVFMEILLRELAGKGIDVEAIGVKTSAVADSLLKVERLLKFLHDPSERTRRIKGTDAEDAPPELNKGEHT